MCEDELLTLIIEEFVNPLGRKLAKKIAERQLGYELDESAKEFPREHAPTLNSDKRKTTT